MLRLSVIVPATNSPPTLPRCLAAIGSSSRAPHEVLVVEEPPFAGPAEARNAGIGRATGDVVVFVDADVIVHPDALERLAERLEGDPGLAAVFGAYDDTVATTRLVAAFRNLLHHHVHTRAPGPADTFWAGLGAVRRDVLVALGGFDEQRFDRPAIEDVELGLRLADAGHRIELVPAARGTHLKDWTLTQMLRTDLLQRGVPWVELLLERGRGSSSLNLGLRERLSALASVGTAGAVLLRWPRAALGGAAAVVALNLPFYRVLVRVLGPARAVACVPLHVAHHLTAALAVPVGLLRALRRRGRRAGPTRG